MRRVAIDELDTKDLGIGEGGRDFDLDRGGLSNIVFLLVLKDLLGLCWLYVSGAHAQ